MRGRTNNLKIVTISQMFIFKWRFLCRCRRLCVSCLERTTMTSDTSENTIFVRFYFILCYLNLLSKSLQSEWATDVSTLHCYVRFFVEWGRTSACKRHSRQPLSVHIWPHPPQSSHRTDHNTGEPPVSSRTACGFFNVPRRLRTLKVCETVPMVLSPYPRRLESLTIWRCNH